MTRVDNWPELLDAFLRERRSRAFEWGVHDCALFAADWVLACTGNDPAADFRGTYQTAKGAVRALKRYGTGALISTWDQRVETDIAVLRAQRGDVVALDTGERDVCLGVVAADGAFVLGLDGLILVPLTHRGLVRGWRI